MRENGKNSTRHIRMVFSILVLVFVLATGTPISNLNGIVAYAKTKMENPKISKKRKNLKRKKSFTIKVSGTKKKVKWSVSDKSLVKIKKKGKNKAKITAKKQAGTCVVKAVASGKTMYCLVTVGGSAKMSETTRKWAVACDFVKNKSDKTDSSKNSGSEEEKQDSTDGNKDKKPSGDTGTGGDKSDKTISDSDGPQKVKYVLINYPEISILEDKSFQLTATAYPIEALNRSISWSSSNASVATVDSNGNVVGIKPGTALDALYKQWLKSIYEKSWASKTNNQFYKMEFLMEYVSIMHGRHIVQSFKDNYIKKGMSAYNKVHLAFRYVREGGRYSMKSKKYWTAWGALVKKSASCYGYARGFKALCDGIGIPCKIVDANKKAVNTNHEWAIVKINKKWYICDPQGGFFLVGAKQFKQVGLRWNTKKYPKVCEENHSKALAYASIM